MSKPAIVRVSLNQLEYWNTAQATWLPVTPNQLGILVGLIQSCPKMTLFDASDRLNHIAKLVAEQVKG